MQPIPFYSSARRIDPQQNDTRDLHRLTKDKRPEVLVFRQQESPLGSRAGDNCDIGSAWLDIRGVHYVMTCIAQLRDQPSIYAFVDEPAHLGPFQPVNEIF